MKGVILAGGNGKRLTPFTSFINKHLLPVYNQPMVYYPLQTLIKSGIKDILLITNRNQIKHFRNIFGSGSSYGIKLQYAAQNKPIGIADALKSAARFTNGSKIAVILGDNIFTSTFEREIKLFNKKTGAMIFLKEVDDPTSFGVAILDKNKIVGIEEKPKKPKSNFAVTGLYLYNSDVFNKLKLNDPSGRGEFEITSINNMYIDDDRMDYKIIKGEWIDAGTFENLAKANTLMTEKFLKKNGKN